MSTLTKAVTYNRPIGWKITIKDFNETVTYQTVTSLDTAPTMYISDVKAQLNTTMSEVNFEVDNSDQTVDPEDIKEGNTVILQAAKDPAFFDDPESYLFIGNIDYPNEAARGYKVHKFNVKVIDVKQILYDTQMDIVKNANANVIDDPTQINSTPFRTHAIIKDVMESKKYTFLNDISVKNRAKLGLTGISTSVNTFMPKVRFHGSAGIFLDDTGDTVGYNWYIDPRGGIRNLTVRYPEQDYIPIIVKAGDSKNINVDVADRTSYITQEFRLESSSGIGGNVASRLFANTRIQSKSIAGNSINATRTSMSFKAIATPFSTIETNFTTLLLTLSKVGEPSNAKDEIHGAIFTNNNGAIGKRIFDFSIPMSSVEEGPTNVFVDLTDSKKLTRPDGFSEFYVVIFECSGFDNTPNHDDANAIYWHRDSNTNGLSLIAQGGDRNDFSQLTWSPHGPSYAFSMFASINRLFAITNYSLVDRIGLKEPAPIDFAFIDDTKTAMKYLSSISYYASLFKIPISLKVTLPDNFLFRPYQVIPNVIETRTMPNGLDLELSEVQYNFAENSNSCCTITGVALADKGFPSIWDCVL